MKNYKFFRVLVSLLLVCCLLVNVSPIKAFATEAFVPKSYSEENIDSLIVAGAIVVGLGVLAESGSATFDSVVEDASSSLGSGGSCSVVSATDGNTKVYYVPVANVESVRASLITGAVISTKDVVSSDGFVPAGTEVVSSTCGTITFNVDSFVFFAKSTLCVFNAAGGYPSVTCSNGSLSIFYFNTAAGTKYLYEIDGVQRGNYSYPYINNNVTDAVMDYWSGELTISPRKETVLATGLVGGVVAATSVSFAKGYEAWSSKTIQLYQWADGTYHNEAESISDNPIAIPFIPLGVKDTYADTVTQTQEDVWAGAVAVPGADTGSGTVSGTVTLPGWVQDGFNNLNNGLKDILSSLLSLPAALAAAIWALLPEWIQDGFYNMKTGFLDVLDSLAALPAAIWSSLPAWLRDGISEMKLGFSDVLDSIASLPVAIAEALAAVFVPSADYISVKVEALRVEFGFIDSVIATGEFIRDSVSGASGPPVIYVDLGRAPSGNYGSQSVLLTDFSWYAPYKGQVDTVLSAALWAFFGWRVFLKLPGIIGGESGYISDVFFPSSSGRSGSDDKKKGGKV